MDRYWQLEYSEFTEDEPHIREVSFAADMPVVAIVDEEAGGVIGYVTVDKADFVVRALNAFEVVNE